MTDHSSAEPDDHLSDREREAIDALAVYASGHGSIELPLALFRFLRANPVPGERFGGWAGFALDQQDAEAELRLARFVAALDGDSRVPG